MYLTTPIYYVNDKPHLGHAYTTIAVDVAARFHRINGKQVKFLTGTDEHGQKVDKAARTKSVPCQEFVDEVSGRFKELVNANIGSNLLNITNTNFIRTTEASHHKAAQNFWQLLVKNGYIYKGKYEGYYSIRDEAFYQESELIDGKAPTGADVEWQEEQSYFFKLSAFTEKLLKFYEENPEFVYPKKRLNEVVSFVKTGLRDLSISRTSFSWGVAVPNDAAHVMYVWIDALTNYLTSAGFPDVASAEYQNFWQNGEPRHIVGKDILRFHAVYWPAFLMAANLPLPKQIIAHGWWTVEGEKMSKSLGNVISPQELIAEYGLDKVRYFLLREVPFGEDGNFAKGNIITRTNAELANNIGNLVSRVLSFINKQSDGAIPIVASDDLQKQDKQLIAMVKEFLQGEYKANMEGFKFHLAIGNIIDFGNFANEYIDKQAPWKLKQSDPARMCAVLYTLTEAIRIIALALYPFTPSSAINMLNQLGFDDATEQNLKIEQIITQDLQAKKLGKLSAIFMRI